MDDTPAASQAFNTAGAKQQPATTQQISAEEKKRREAVNKRMVRLAQGQFDKVTETLNGNSYTVDLRQQERDVNIAQGPQGRQTFILDPATFDAGVALGLKPADVVRNMILGPPPALYDVLKPRYVDGQIKDAQIFEPRDVRAVEDYLSNEQLFDFATIADNMGMRYRTRTGADTHTQFPSAHGTSDACVIVPSSDHGSFKVRGLTHEENIAYTNLHEGWHCRDSRRRRDNPAGQPFDPAADIRQVPDHAATRENYARNNQRESFADVAAVGEMIRGGKGMAVLDAVMDYRQRDAWEVRHYTLPCLRAFKDEIEKMGIDKFRKLNANDAEKIYQRVVDNHALTAKGVEVIANSESLNPLKWVGPTVITRFYDDDVSRALAFRRSHTMDRMIGAAKDMVTFDPSTTSVRLALDKWNADKVLQDRAFADARKITPATLIAAYGKIKDELRTKISQNPQQSALYEAQLTKLQDSLPDAVQKTDYVAANLARGVKIEDVEPTARQPAAAKPVTAKIAGT